MTQPELDRLISEWETTLAKMRANLKNQDDSATAQMAAATALKGKTLKAVAPVQETMRRLFTHLSRAQEAIDAIKAKRAEMGMFNRATILAEVEQMLTGPVVKLPIVKAAGTKHVGILHSDDDTRNVTLSAWKDEMIADFAPCEAEYERLNDAWQQRVADMQQLNKEVAQLRARYTSEGLTETAPALVTLVNRLAEVEKMRVEDPYGHDVSTLKAAILKPLNAAYTCLAEFVHDRSQLATEVGETQQLMECLREARVTAKQQYADCEKSILVDAATLAAPPSVKTLGEQADALSQDVTAKRFDGLRDRLSAWLVSYNQVKAQVQAAVAGTARLIQQRSELVRRWTKAQMTAQQHADKLSGKKALATFRTRAEAAMGAEKIDLTAADSAVSAFEVCLGELLAS